MRACGVEDTDDEKEQEKELAGIFKTGAHFKIEEKNGQLWTARITSVQGRTINFIDKHGEPAGVHYDNIKGYRRIRGGTDG